MLAGAVPRRGLPGRQRSRRLRAGAEGGGRRRRAPRRRGRAHQPRRRPGARGGLDLYGFTQARPHACATPERLGPGVGSAGCRWAPPRFVACASSTPPTGTWAGPSTVRGCSAHQAAYVDHLLEVVESERVDLVVVAGDVYDRALPHVDAVRLADEALARLAASRAAVVVTSGNHDSAQRLGFGSRLIDAAGVHLRTDAATVGTPVLLGDEHGPVAVHGLPYLDPDAVREPWGLPGALPRGGADRGDAPGARRPRRPPGARSVVLAHAFVAGAAAERLRARHQRRRRLPGADQRLRRHRLRRARPPARRHTPHRRASATAARRWPTPSPRPTSARAPGWSTSTPPASRRAEFVEAPVPRPLARLTRRPRGAAHRPRRSRVHEHAWVAGHPHRRGPPGPGHGAAAPTLPAHPGPGLRRHRARPRRPARGAHPRPHRPRHRRRLRRRPARRAGHRRPRPRCCTRAVDACCDDPDARRPRRRGVG